MPVIQFSNAVIDDISRDQDNTLVTVTYRGGPDNRRSEQTVRLVAGPRTVIMNEQNRPIPASSLRTGMTVDGAYSSAMTRSIPPQAQAFFLKVKSRPSAEPMAVGRVLEVDRNGRSFTTIRDRDPSSVIRFMVTEHTRFFDRMGRPMQFSELSAGMRVRVRHAEFMTASIPPQTTAFEVRVM